MKIIMVGPPGSGKGTQSDRISYEYDIPHFSIGEILRKHVTEQTPIGIKIKNIMSSGSLVTDDIVIEVTKETLRNEAGWVLDGFPRSVAQAEWIIKNYPEAKKIYLDCDRNICTDRIQDRAKSSKRSDDSSDAISIRFKAYEEISLPGTKLFKDMVTINGSQSKSEVFREIKLSLQT